MKIKIWLWFTFLILFLLNGCTDRTQSSAAGNKIPFTFIDSSGRQPKSWNEKIRLELPENYLTNTMKFNSIITIAVFNLSDQKVKFPTDCNIRIFDYTNGIEEIPNTVKYSGVGPVLEPGTQKVASNSIIGFSPGIQGIGERKIRIYVIGEILNPDPQRNELAGAYLDIIVHP